MTEPITPDERKRRSKAVASANANIALEGLTVSPEVETVNARFLRGEITSHEQIEIVRGMYGLTDQPKSKK